MIKLITNPADKKSYNCYSGGVCYLLERNGLDLSEHVSFGLSAGLSFTVGFAQNKFSFRAVRTLHCLTDFLKSLGIQVIEHRTDSFFDMFKTLKGNIDRDFPFMMEYDAYYVPFTPNYGKEHEKRIGMAIGYDIQTIYISDFIYGIYKYEIDINVLESACLSELSGCVGPKWYDVMFPNDIMNQIDENLIAEALIDTMGHMTKKEHTGIHAIRELSKETSDFIKYPHDTDWTEFSKELKQFIILCQHYGDFIYTISEKCMIPFDIQCAKTVQGLFSMECSKWKIISNMIFKYGKTGNSELPGKIKTLLIESADILEDAFQKIGNELNKRTGS